MTTPAPTTALAGGSQMPQLGLGTWPLVGEDCAAAVASAIEVGYRLIDTAENYENEDGVGEGISRSGVARADLFVTSKFNKKWHSVDGVRQACEASLERLGLDYLDLFLIHWPNPKQGTYVEAFEGLLAVQEAGLVRAVGTSNFKAHHLADLFARGFTPEVNQIQFDPHTLRADLVALHREHGIVTEAWRPFGEGGSCTAEAAVQELAAKYGKTPQQIVLRWIVQQGHAACPKSADPTRQAANLDVFDFALTADEMATIADDRPDPKKLDADRFGH
ncbi:MAG: aldo/keto reductase [Austwickia sp.]|jgi:2,5-diketo-D-gluconate reductase A|nr:MAG: aldo/keto reductase [Austwickia sp.]